MWTTSSLIGWLDSLGITPGGTVDLPVVPGPYLPKLPDRLAVVTTIAGVGESMEGVADTPGFQLLIRGRQDATHTDASAEQDALRADRLIRFAPLPALIDGNWLMPVTRSGGRPSPIPQLDTGDRLTFTCTYLTPVIEETG